MFQTRLWLAIEQRRLPRGLKDGRPQRVRLVHQYCLGKHFVLYRMPGPAADHGEGEGPVLFGERRWARIMYSSSSWGLSCPCAPPYK